MIDLFKDILEVAKRLLGLSDALRTAERQRRQDMADLFEKVSVCLSTVSSEIRMGGVPHGRCGELEMYAQELPTVIRKEVGDLRATELGKMLRSAHRVEDMAVRLSGAANKEPFLQEIEEASGKFQALANIVRSA